VSGTGQPGAGGAEDELAALRRLMRFGEAETIIAPPWMEHDTSVRTVEAHLAGLWTATTSDDGDPLVTEKGLPHARASVLNLIATVPDAASAERVVATMLGLGMRHPSRAIVLVADPDAPGRGIDASVTAHCHPAATSGDKICYEEVVLTVRGEVSEHLSGVVAPLLIHDLPTLVWWPGDPPFADPIFDQLVEVGDRLIVDTGDFADLGLGMRRLASLRRRSGIGDLSWRRIGWWQELTAQFFDAPRFRRYLPNLNRLAIRYAVPVGVSSTEMSAALLVQPLLFAGWIASRLAWKRYATLEPLAHGRLRLKLEGRYEMVDLVLEPVETGELPAGELISTRLRSLGETGAAEFIIDREGDEATVASNADGMTALLRRVHMERPTESELLAASLVTERHDDVYETSLRAAAIILASARELDAAG
jgi:glucose-6-phosphate dehydrogenase assembly protein OpcA